MSDHAISIQEADAILTAPGQMFETERALVKGIEMTVWKNAPTNLRQMLDASLNHGDLEFLVYEDQRYSFREHYAIVATLAHRLIDQVTKGDRVAIASRNLPQWSMAFWGAASLGAIVTPLNAWWTTEELAYGLRDSGSSILFVDGERLDRIFGLIDDLPDLTTIIVFGDPARPVELRRHHRVPIVTFEEFVGDIDRDVPPNVELAPDDDVTMFYTSGTTGHPKGAVGSHRNVITNFMNLSFGAYRGALRAGVTHDPRAPSAQGIGLLNVPFFHATGCFAVLVPSAFAGTKIVLMHHFDAGKALEVIERERVTMIGGVPTVAMQIIDHPDFARFDTSSVTSIAYGGAPAPPELVSRLRTHFPLGLPSNGYGLTETSAALASNPGLDYVNKPASCGPCYPINEVAVVPEDYPGAAPGDDLPKGPGVLGELWVKGPNVIREYWNKPEATASTFTTEGWLRTGDIARIDDEGFIFIVDRAKDMIIRGGENVYSVIVEAAIFEHPDVQDCAVIGVPHPTFGEEVAAVVVLRPGRVMNAEEVGRHVAARLAKFEVPTQVIFRSEPLPRNPQGKVLKRELRDSLA
jgi:long-chain acyl-CoA synthetase